MYLACILFYLSLSKYMKFFFYIYSVMLPHQHLPLVLLQKTMDVLQYVLIKHNFLYFKWDNMDDSMSFQHF